MDSEVVVERQRSREEELGERSLIVAGWIGITGFSAFLLSRRLSDRSIRLAAGVLFWIGLFLSPQILRHLLTDRRE